MICPELGVAPRIDPGTDLEDELSDLADSPAAADHGVAPLSVPADVDIDLEQVFGDIGSLPAMVTPICDFDELMVAQPPMVTSPAGPTVVSPGFLQPSTGSVGCLLVLPTVPVVSTPEKSLLLGAAEMTQGQPWAGPSSWGGGGGGGESVGSHFPAAPLAPRPVAASPQDNESDAAGGYSDVHDLSREGPFDIHQDRPHSGASPRLLQGTQGCPFRMTSYDEENSGPDFNPAYGVQLHDPRLLEYVSRSPEHWVHHMGREKTLSAALQLQHDAGLILSNVQVLQQLVTALNRTSSDVLRAIHGRRPFPTSTMHQVMPSYRFRRAAHYMTAMGLWRPPIAQEIRGPLLLATCNASCSDCFPDVPL